MRPEDLTKEQVVEMSDAEVKFWCQHFAEQEQVAKLRKHMLTQVEICDEGRRANTIKIDSKVIE